MKASTPPFGPGLCWTKEINTLEELAEALDNPVHHYAWIEGLGSPSCYQDQLMWKAMAKFIREKVVTLRGNK